MLGTNTEVGYVLTLRYPTFTTIHHILLGNDELFQCANINGHNNDTDSQNSIQFLIEFIPRNRHSDVGKTCFLGNHAEVYHTCNL